MLIEFLQDEKLASIIQVTVGSSETEARAAVDRRETDVAIIIPENLTAAVERPDTQAAVIVYHEPTLTIAPTIAKMLIGDLLDGFSGAKIAVEVTNRLLTTRGLEHDAATVEAVALRYASWVELAGGSQQGDSADPAIITRMPQEENRPTNAMTLFLGPVMAGMMIFFGFFTGSAAAQSILYEDEEGRFWAASSSPCLLR
jgi:hypothetical protein